MIKNPSCYPRWQQYNTCLASPAVTGKGHRKIEPKAKHFSHCKKDHSSRPNQTDNSKRLAKNSEEIQIFLIDKLDHKPTIHRISTNTTQKELHQIDLQEDRGGHGIDIQTERKSHLASNYGPEGLC